MEIQILRAGQLLILCVPGELTTMAGRRRWEAVHDQVRAVLGVWHAYIKGSRASESYVPDIYPERLTSFLRREMPCRSRLVHLAPCDWCLWLDYFPGDPGMRARTESCLNFSNLINTHHSALQGLEARADRAR